MQKVENYLRNWRGIVRYTSLAVNEENCRADKTRGKVD